MKKAKQHQLSLSYKKQALWFTFTSYSFVLYQKIILQELLHHHQFWILFVYASVQMVSNLWSPRPPPGGCTFIQNFFRGLPIKKVENHWSILFSLCRLVFHHAFQLLDDVFYYFFSTLCFNPCISIPRLWILMFQSVVCLFVFYFFYSFLLCIFFMQYVYSWNVKTFTPEWIQANCTVYIRCLG